MTRIREEEEHFYFRLLARKNILLLQLVSVKLEVKVGDLIAMIMSLWPQWTPLFLAFPLVI